MALGFGGSVANLKATLTLDDDGFIRGMSDASAKLDAYNAKLKEEGVSKRLATMASKDYARQLYDEARGVDQATASHGRLFTMLQRGQTHWKALSVATAGAGVGILALTGHLGVLSGTALPAVNAALTGLLSPFTSLAAIVAGLAAPLSALVTLFGAVGAGAGFGLYSALTSNNKAFNDLQNRVGNMGHMFRDLGVTLGERFLPYINSGVTTIERFIKYADKLAHMSLPQVIHSISTQGMHMLEQVNQSIYNLIGRPLLEIFSASFGKAGNRISGAFAQILQVWSPLVGRMWGIFTRWFDRQHFTQVGAQWAAAVVNTAVPVIVHGLWSSLRAVFSDASAWGKLGLIAGGYFAANFFSGGLLKKLVMGGGRGLLGMLGGGAAEAGGGLAGAGAGGVAGGGGIISAIGGAAGVAAIVGVAVPAALVYLSSRQSASSQNKFGITQGVHPRGPGSPGYVPGSIAAGASKDEAALRRVAAAEKTLNQYISDGGKSVRGWQLAVERATHQAGDAQSAIHDLADKGIISADQAASQSKANLQNYISQEDAIAKKATAASQNTAKFGASTRAQYAHVAALARTSAQLAQAIDSIPSQKYVSLVLSITENLKTEGLNPGNQRTKDGLASQRGSFIGGAGNGDIVPAMLEPGEGVLNRNAVAALGGKAAIDAINAAIPRFASGGFVPPPRHKKETRGHYLTRVSGWLSNQVSTRSGQYDFGISLADRVAQRDDQEGNITGELAQLGKEQKLRGEEIRMLDRARRVALRFGFTGQARQYNQTALMLHQDVLDTRDQIKGLKGATGAGGSVSQAQLASFLAAQMSFLNEFASNIILPGAQAVLSGGVSGGLSSTGPTVPNRYLKPGSGASIVHNHTYQFLQTPPDAMVHMRRAKLQAESVWS